MPNWGNTVSIWDTVAREIREQGFFHLPTLAEALRGSEPVPHDVREFLADLAEGGQIKRKDKDQRQGRPHVRNLDDEESRNRLIRGIYEDELELFKEGLRPKDSSDRDRPTAGSPKDVALARTKDILADEYGIHLESDAINKIIKRR